MIEESFRDFVKEDHIDETKFKTLLCDIFLYCWVVHVWQFDKVDDWRAIDPKVPAEKIHLTLEKKQEIHELKNARNLNEGDAKLRTKFNSVVAKGKVKFDDLQRKIFHPEASPRHVKKKIKTVTEKTIGRSLNVIDLTGDTFEEAFNDKALYQLTGEQFAELKKFNDNKKTQSVSNSSSV